LGIFFLKKKLYWVNKYTIIAGDPEEPTTLMSTLLLQTHAPRLYSLALTQFLWTSTKNVWNANNPMFSRASHVFGPWIKWNSGTATVPSSPNRHFLLTVYVAFEPLSPQNNCIIYYKPRSKHRAITVKSAQNFTSGSKIFHYPKNQTCITRLIKIILNAQLITT